MITTNGSMFRRSKNGSGYDWEDWVSLVTGPELQSVNNKLTYHATSISIQASDQIKFRSIDIHASQARFPAIFCYSAQSGFGGLALLIFYGNNEVSLIDITKDMQGAAYINSITTGEVESDNTFLITINLSYTYGWADGWMIYPDRFNLTPVYS